MRPIDGDALLEKFNRKADIWTALTDEDTASDFAFYCKLADAVEEMPTIGGWISVKDRLPEEGVCLGCHGSSVGIYENVTHWMPIPEPPKEVSGE